jgi:hypothetical protein
VPLVIAKICRLYHRENRGPYNGQRVVEGAERHRKTEGRRGEHREVEGTRAEERTEGEKRTEGHRGDREQYRGKRAVEGTERPRGGRGP